MALNREINHDILLNILSLSSQSVITAFMQTCRTLYHDGAKEMLRRRVLIESATALKSFLHFLNADNDARVSYLRNLSIHLYVITQETAQSLSHCVGMMSGLQCLSIQNVEKLHDMCPDLGPTLAKLKTIEVLTFVFIGPKTLNTLRQMRSPIRVLTLKKYVNSKLRGFSTMDSIELVAHLSPTLEELECISISQHHSEAVYPKFPRMRRLRITHMHEPLIARYHAAFPNLIDLTILCPPAPPSTVLRERNLRLLSQSSGNPGLWKQIDSFTGDLAVVYSFGVPCRIDKLHLGLISAGEMDVLTTVLSETTPQHLSLCLSHSFLQRNIEPRFVAIMRSPGAVRIRSLELSMQLRSMHGLTPMNVNMEEVFGDLLSALKAISLEKFILTMYDGSEIFSGDDGLSEFLDHITRQIPTLDEASVEVTNPKKRESGIMRFLRQ